MTTLTAQNSFAYHARTADGGWTRGTIQAHDADEARAALADMALDSPVLSKPSHAQQAPAYPGMVTNVAVPLWIDLSCLADAQSSRRRCRSLRRLASLLRDGRPLQDAWRLERREFPRRDRPLLDIAVANSRLPSAIMSTSPFDAREQEYNSQLRRTFVAALLSWIIACAIVAVFFGDITPQFERLFEDLNYELPILTLNLLNFGRWLSGTLYPHQAFPGLIVAGAIVAGVVVIAVYVWSLMSRPDPAALDPLLFRIPWMGRAVRARRNVAFGRAASLAMAAGVDRRRAITLACRTLGSRRLLRDGIQLLVALRRNDPLPERTTYRVVIPQLVAVLTTKEKDPRTELTKFASFPIPGKPVIARIGVMVALMFLLTTLWFMMVSILALSCALIPPFRLT